MTNDPTSAAYALFKQVEDAILEWNYGGPGVVREAIEQAIAEAETRGRIDEHAKLIEHGKHHGFERLETVVEYQDGTSADIPYRHHWNDCYDKFVVASNSRINAIKGLNPYGEPLQANADGANGRGGEDLSNE